MLATVGRQFFLSSRSIAACVTLALLTYGSNLRMAQASGNAIEPGDMAPNFTLSAADGKAVSLSDFMGKTVVLEWFNAGCPFVMRHYRAHSMQNLQERYTAKGVVWLTINSTSPNHRDFLDYPAAEQFRKEHSVRAGTYLVDKDGQVGKLFGAKTTPHFFIINSEGKLAYQGAIDDDSDTASDPAKARSYVVEALDALLAHKAVTVAKTASYGCSVKYAS